MSHQNKENQAMQKGERRQRIKKNQNNVGDKQNSLENKNVVQEQY